MCTCSFFSITAAVIKALQGQDALVETSVNYAFSFMSLTPTCFCSSLRFDLPPEKRVKVSVDVRVVHLHAGDAAASENSCEVVGF